MRTDKKHDLALRRHWRVRKKISGTAERPRMSVCFSARHIRVQFIDDGAGKTLASASTVGKAAGGTGKGVANVENAKRLGRVAADAAKAKGIEKVVFDRGGARYHGKVKALADAAREAGLKL
jgi:large subunit ribosomal protein L18